MAGPGGGAPRKSHTKSRKGCRMCKRRHIRCDENFPQCRNCTKHSVRCDYMDVSKAGEEPAKGAKPPELLTSPELQLALDNWRLTGHSPLVELRKSDLTYWTRFSTIDLRLIHHVTTLSSDLYRRGYSQCLPWTPKMSTLISVSLSSDFAMNALLAFSASHLAWQTKNNDTDHLAYHHRGIALKGLHEALSTFSDQNSEAVLATSMLLVWQARDWQSWVSLQQGISTVLNAMRQWMHQSELAKFLESQRTLARARMPNTPSLTGLPPQQPGTEDLQKLDQTVTALHNLRLRLSSFPELVEHIDDILEFAEQLQNDYPLRDISRAFETLLQLRSAIFWVPTSVLQPEERDLGALAMLSHFYALALVLEPLFPECAGLYLGNMALDPLDKVCATMQSRGATDPQDTIIQTALTMLEVPMQLAYAYRSSHRVITSPNIRYGYTTSPNTSISSYSAQSYHLPTPPDLTRHASYPGAVHGPSGVPNYSYSPSNAYQAPMDGRNTSVLNRTQSDSRQIPISAMTNIPNHHNQNEVTTNVDYFAGTASYPNMPNYVGMNEFQNRPQPEPLRSNAEPINQRYSTIPPPINARSTFGGASDYENMSSSNQRGGDGQGQGWG